MTSSLNPSLNLLPALTLQMQMRGLATLGIDMRRVHAAVGPVPESPDTLVPVQTYLDMWAEAQAQFGMSGLAGVRFKLMWATLDL